MNILANGKTEICANVICALENPEDFFYMLSHTHTQILPQSDISERIHSK